MPRAQTILRQTRTARERFTRSLRAAPIHPAIARKRADEQPTSLVKLVPGTRMQFLPIFFKLQARPCLVVGGTEAAARKVRLLSKAGAKVTVVAPQLVEALQRDADAGRLTVRLREFERQDLQGQWLVVVASDDRAHARSVAETAHQMNVPVNVVDQASLCSFIMPSIIDRSPMVVAVSTGGTAPVLARMMRTRLESMIPANFAALTAWAEQLRDRVRQHIPEARRRRVFWENNLEGRAGELALAGNPTAATEVLNAQLAEPDSGSRHIGEVYLVGAGPGDPDLLTLRALRLMQQADVVVYDRLVSAAVVDLTRRDATRIFAGKERGRHAIPQENINTLLVRLAREGNRVLRLKGGDPFIFGRGGEEIDTLSAEGVPFQVVPGITAASGCAAYAGIPLTHRDYAQTCVFVTGHLKDDRVNLDWQALNRPRQTIVIYMGLIGLPRICAELIEHGVSAQTPAALVQQGTTAAQRVFTGTLKTLPGLVADGEAKAPTLIIIGEVVRLRDKLAWFQGSDAAGNAFARAPGNDQGA